MRRLSRSSSFTTLTFLFYLLVYIYEFPWTSPLSLYKSSKLNAIFFWIQDLFVCVDQSKRDNQQVLSRIRQFRKWRVSFWCRNSWWKKLQIVCYPCITSCRTTIVAVKSRLRMRFISNPQERSDGFELFLYCLRYFFRILTCVRSPSFSHHSLPSRLPLLTHSHPPYRNPLPHSQQPLIITPPHRPQLKSLFPQLKNTAEFKKKALEIYKKLPYEIRSVRCFA